MKRWRIVTKASRLPLVSHGFCLGYDLPSGRGKLFESRAAAEVVLKSLGRAEARRHEVEALDVP